MAEEKKNESDNLSNTEKIKLLPLHVPEKGSNLSPQSIPQNASPSDRTNLKRAASSPTLSIPAMNTDLYQRSEPGRSPGLSPGKLNSGVDPGAAQLYVSPNQDPLGRRDTEK